MPALSPRVRGILATALRLAVSVALLWWLYSQLRGQLEAEVRRVLTTSPWLLVPPLLVFALSTVLGAWQWTLILRRAGLDVPPGRLHALYWVGLFFNNFLPTNVGGDLVKVADVAVETGRVARPIAGTLLDRMLGLSALVGLAFVAGAALGGEAPAGLPWWALTVVAVPAIAGTLAILSGRLGRLVVSVSERLRRGRGKGRFRALLGVLQDYRSDPSFVLRLGLLAVLVQSLRIGTHLLVALAMGLTLDWERALQLYVLVPVLGMAVVLPLSFNGLGIRELVAYRLMPQIGIDADSAVVMQLITYLVQVTVSLAGGVVFTVMFVRGRLRLRRRRSEV